MDGAPVRIRQVKPEFWRDTVIAGLTPLTRLTYIGLWMLADDGGWFRLDEPEIALELYGWEPRGRRERTVHTAVVTLVAKGRIEAFDCGHGFIPKFTEHQRFSVAAKRVYTFKKEHEAHLAAPDGDTPAGSRDTPAGSRDIPARYGKGIGTVTGNGTGKESKGTVNARERADDDDERAAVIESYRRQGLPVDA